jgi:cobalt-precorrin 5A hydrolase
LRVAVLTLTREGKALGKRIAEALGEAEVDLYASPRHSGGGIQEIRGSLKDFVGALFKEYDALVFVMATGIVVRSLAGHIRDKRADPAVVVLDEKGEHVISLLSGHVGKANRLAREIASRIGARPVITTSTDVQGLPCVEDLAEAGRLKIEDFSKVKAVNAAIANGEQVAVFTDAPRFLDLPLPPSMPVVSLDDPPSVGEQYGAWILVTNRELPPPLPLPGVILRPKNLVVGVGARKGVSKEKVLTALRKALGKAGLSPHSLRVLATIDAKAEEVGIREAARELRLPLKILPASEIRKVEDRYGSSETVRNAVGVGAVCEPAAVLAGKRARLLQGKFKYGGVTIAIAEEGDDEGEDYADRDRTRKPGAHDPEGPGGDPGVGPDHRVQDLP